MNRILIEMNRKWNSRNGIEWPILISHSDPIQFSQVPLCSVQKTERRGKFLALTTGSWDLGQISSTMESTQSSARRPSRLTYKEASGMAATLSMLEDIGALHAALKISTENDKDQLLWRGEEERRDSRLKSRRVGVAGAAGERRIVHRCRRDGK